MIEITFDLSRWITELEVAQTKVATVSKSLFKDAVTSVYNSAVKLTPIGRPELWKYPAPSNYHPGTLRSSWQMEMVSDVEALIGNPEPYAVRVENGWSTQRPEGMLRVSVAKWETLLDEVAEKYYGSTGLFNSGLYENF